MMTMMTMTMMINECERGAAFFIKEEGLVTLSNHQALAAGRWTYYLPTLKRIAQAF